jgi:hypothetical protein
MCVVRRNARQEVMLYGVGHLKLTLKKFEGNMAKHQLSGKDLCKKDKGQSVSFIKKDIASMRKDAILSMMVKVVVKDQKEMAKGKEKANRKGKEKAVVKAEEKGLEIVPIPPWLSRRRKELKILKKILSRQ